MAIALIIGGGQNLYTALANRTITEVTIESVAQEHPKASWLRVTGGELDTANAAYSSILGVGSVTEMYIPLVPPGTDSSKSTIHLLVLTKDPELLAFTNEARKLEKANAGDGALTSFFLKNMDKVRPARPVEGLVKFGIESRSKDEDKIRALYPNLDAKFVLVEEGKEPSAGLGLLTLTGGLLLGGFLVLRGRKKAPPVRSSNPSAPPPPAA